MWEVSEVGAKELQDWIDEHGDRELIDKCRQFHKQSKMIFDYDEIMVILKPLAEHYPIYRFVEQMSPHVPVIEKVINPEYQERIIRLRTEQANKEYQKMIESVDPKQLYGRESVLRDFGQELKAVNRQVIVVFNTLLTVAGGFCFAFFGIGYAYPGLKLSLAARMVLGLTTATIIFFADLYFIVKGMDQSDSNLIKTNETNVKRKRDAQKRKMKDEGITNRIEK